MAEDETLKAPSKSKLPMTLGVILIVVLLFALGYWVIQNTPVGASLKLSLSKGMTSISESISGVKKQATDIGDWSNPTTTKKEMKGVEITDIVHNRVFLPTDNILITGRGYVRALEDEISVDLFCSMDEILGEVDSNQASITVLPNIERPFGVLCSFEPFSDIKTTTQKQVKFGAIYTNYKTDAELGLWTLPKMEMDALNEAGIDPFRKYENIFKLQRTKPLFKLDDKFRTTTSIYDYGPMRVSMQVINIQPLSEGVKYKLLINIQNDKVGWGGELVKRQTGDMGRVIVKLPSNFESNCGEFVFELGQEEYGFDCDFTIRTLDVGLGWIIIEAEVVYDYGFSKTETITIAPLKELV